jgi:hypothetical protein
MVPALADELFRLGDEVCRACGKGGHTVIAGIPRRLVPCDGLPTVIPPLCTPER